MTDAEQLQWIVRQSDMGRKVIATETPSGFHLVRIECHGEPAFYSHGDTFREAIDNLAKYVRGRLTQ